MSRPPFDLHKILIDGMEKWIKVICYLWLANIAFDILIVLPPDIGNRVIEYVLKKFGI
jgi:hypothetical protein